MATPLLDPITLLSQEDVANDPLRLLEELQPDTIPGVPEVPVPVAVANEPDIAPQAPTLDVGMGGSPLDLGYPQTGGTIGVPQAAIQTTDGLPADLGSLDDETAGALAQAYANKQDLDARAAERMRLYESKMQDEEFQKRDRQLDLWRNILTIPAILLGAPGVHAVRNLIEDPSKKAEAAHGLALAGIQTERDRVEARIKELVDRRRAAQEALADETTARRGQDVTSRGQDLDYDLGLRTIAANAAKRKADAAEKARGALTAFTPPGTEVPYQVPTNELDRADTVWKETYLDNKSVQGLREKATSLDDTMFLINDVIYNPDQANLKALSETLFRATSPAALARTIGQQKGVLSDKDVALYEKLGGQIKWITEKLRGVFAGEKYPQAEQDQLADLIQQLHALSVRAITAKEQQARDKALSFVSTPEARGALAYRYSGHDYDVPAEPTTPANPVDDYDTGEEY